ncbi:MAG: hypothetical protein AAF693_01840 [Bacteroidota bacterium]
MQIEKPDSTLMVCCSTDLTDLHRKINIPNIIKPTPPQKKPELMDFSIALVLFLEKDKIMKQMPKPIIAIPINKLNINSVDYFVPLLFGSYHPKITAARLYRVVIISCSCRLTLFHLLG